MALRIGEYVTSGELRNSRRNGVYGWLEFSPEFGIRIELTGNFAKSLEGKHIRFRAPDADERPPLEADNLPEPLAQLADRQIGVVGDVKLRRVKVPDLPMDEFLQLPESERDSHLTEKDALFFEWFSQNGRVVAELLEPEIEYVDPQGDGTDDPVEPEPLPDGGYGVGFTEIHIDEEGITHTEHFPMDESEEGEEEDESDDEEDPYGLFGEDLEKKVAESLGEMDEGGPWSPRDWQEFVPEIWNEIFEGKKDEPISYLFKTPLKLPKPDRVETDEEAEPLVKSILAQLALLSVALDVCEHFTPLNTYRLLMEEILPTAKVHPNLAESEMVQHYSTSDYCPICEAEFDAEYDATQASGKEPQREGDLVEPDATADDDDVSSSEEPSSESGRSGKGDATPPPADESTQDEPEQNQDDDDESKSS